MLKPQLKFINSKNDIYAENYNKHTRNKNRQSKNAYKNYNKNGHLTSVLLSFKLKISSCELKYYHKYFVVRIKTKVNKIYGFDQKPCTHTNTYQYSEIFIIYLFLIKHIFNKNITIKNHKSNFKKPNIPNSITKI